MNHIDFLILATLSLLLIPGGRHLAAVIRLSGELKRLVRSPNLRRSDRRFIRRYWLGGRPYYAAILARIRRRYRRVRGGARKRALVQYAIAYRLCSRSRKRMLREGKCILLAVFLLYVLRATVGWIGG